VGVDQIGQDSGGALLVRIDDNDKTVGLLKKANKDGNEPATARRAPAESPSK